MSAPAGKSTSPILDLSYRSYDGPLDPPTFRWWAIAKLSMRQTWKKKGFWMWGLASGYWYLILMAVFYFADQFSSGVRNSTRVPSGVDPMRAFFEGIKWDVMFVNAFSISQLFLFIVALLLGSGAIANDNRANALLVYLSKPCDKKDYLIGKWVGIFLPIVLVTAAPTLVFYLYCLLSYQQYGFLSQDGWLGLRLLALCLVPGVFHASASLGISSMFSQARLAGATYAAVYFILLFFTKSMETIYRAGGAPNIVANLYYASVDGIQIGLAKVLLTTDGGSLFPAQVGGSMQSVPPAPNGWLFAAIYFATCLGFLALAWKRVRAVEVVG